MAPALVNVMAHVEPPLYAILVRPLQSRASTLFVCSSCFNSPGRAPTAKHTLESQQQKGGWPRAGQFA
jgi:hypothetical protein